MAGFPVIADSAFDAKAPGYLFGYQTLTDPAWKKSVTQALGSGAPLLVSPAFLRAAGEQKLDEAALTQLHDKAIELPANSDPNHWRALEAMPQDQLDALRDKATRGLGVKLHAPARVALYLFGDDVAVVESFRDQPSECSLAMDGWKGYEVAVRMPADSAVAGAGQGPARFTLPARSLVALRRKR